MAGSLFSQHACPPWRFGPAPQIPMRIQEVLNIHGLFGVQPELWLYGQRCSCRPWWTLPSISNPSVE